MPDRSRFGSCTFGAAGRGQTKVGMTGSSSPDRMIRPPNSSLRSRGANSTVRAGWLRYDSLLAGSWAGRYGLPILLVALALIARDSLLPNAGDRSPFQMFLLAALLSALAGGFGPGMLATVAGAMLAVYLYLPPSGDIRIETRIDALRLLLFLIEGLLASVAGEAVRRAANRERMLSLGAERFRTFLRDAASSRSLPTYDDMPLVEELSVREIEVVRLAALGLRNDEIAERLFVSRNTVKTHLSHVYAKLGVRTRTEAVARSIDLGLLVERSGP